MARVESHYMPDTVDVDCDGNGAYFGLTAVQYFIKPELRDYIQHLVACAKASQNRHFVVEGTTLKAAQTRRIHALLYMDPGRVLVSVEVPNEC